MVVRSRDDTPIAVFSNGEGPGLVLVHGATADHTAFRVDWMPFGGRGPSGLGMGGMGHTVHEMTRPKMIVLNAGG